MHTDRPEAQHPAAAAAIYHPNEVWWVPQVSLCLPLIRADQGLLWGSPGLEDKGKQGRCTDVRFLGGSRREGEGFTRIPESKRRRVIKYTQVWKHLQGVSHWVFTSKPLSNSIDYTSTVQYTNSQNSEHSR